MRKGCLVVTADLPYGGCAEEAAPIWVINGILAARAGLERRPRQNQQRSVNAR
jgi:hypothetical protein